MSENPYEAPAAPLALQVEGRIQVIDGDLHIPIGATVPPVCLRTGEDGDLQPRTRTLVWCTPWVALAILVHLFVLLILYFVLRKKGSLTFSITAGEERRLRRRRMTAWALLAGTGLCLVAAIVLGSFWLILPALGLLIGAGVFGSIARPLAIRRITKTHIVLKGVHPRALERIAALTAA
ncbi:MAG: hypothetical protein RLZZ127_321 [Planctomycetota bacterium]|jgi:hypothetical protein